MSIESPTFRADAERESQEERERREKQEAWLQLHLWMSHRLKDEREGLAPGEYIHPDSVHNALQQYRDLPQSEGWKDVTREELDPAILVFYLELRSQGRTGPIALRRTGDGPVEEFNLFEAQVVRNIDLLQPEINTMQEALAGQSREPLDAVSVGYLASWATQA